MNAVTCVDFFQAPKGRLLSEASRFVSLWYARVASEPARDMTGRILYEKITAEVEIDGADRGRLVYGLREHTPISALGITTTCPRLGRLTTDGYRDASLERIDLRPGVVRFTFLASRAA